MQSFDVETLKQSPELSAFVVSEYFGVGNSGQSQRLSRRLNSRTSLVDSGRRSTFVEAARRSITSGPRSSLSLTVDEPLTFQRVHRASHAAGALFRWCTTTLVEVMDPEPDKPKEEILSTSAGESDGESPSSSSRVTAEPEPQEILIQNSNPLPALATQAVATLAAAAAVAVVDAVEPPPVRTPVIVAKVAPKPKPKPPPRLVLTAATPPDRHFELFAVFDLGNARLPVGAEAALQTVASTMCIRPGLSLELQACPDRIEHEALSRTRVAEVQKWFADNALSSSICTEPRFVKSGEEPGVVCRILLHRDRALRDYFILRDNPQEDEDIKFSREVIRDALMLEEDFKVCKH